MNLVNEDSFTAVDLMIERGITLPQRMLIFFLPFPLSTNVHDRSIFTLNKQMNRCLRKTTKYKKYLCLTNNQFHKQYVQFIALC
jgi:hypothetical protein